MALAWQAFNVVVGIGSAVTALRRLVRENFSMKNIEFHVFSKHGRDLHQEHRNALVRRVAASLRSGSTSSPKARAARGSYIHRPLLSP
ncbi:hypothetical protein DFH06DRAFT_1332080 [Mycena polygramma]|nr:hypothetical protein DFH06DRAFT_1332080 [Mycena polygramma]